MSASPGQPLGGPAEEARRLVEALGDWATTKLSTVDAQIATGSAECQVCPVCQLIAALRGDGPEVLSRLNDAWAAFLGVLTEHRHSGPAPDPGTPTDPGTAPDPGTTPTDSATAPGSATTPDPPATYPPADSAWPVRQVQNIEIR